MHQKHASSEYSFRLNGPLSERMENSLDNDDNYHCALRLYGLGSYQEALELFL